MENKINELLEELKYNQNINFEKDLENRVNIDYIIERLEDILKEENKYSNYEKAILDEIDYVIEIMMNNDDYYADETLKKIENLTFEDKEKIMNILCYDEYLNEKLNNDIEWELTHYKSEERVDN